MLLTSHTYKTPSCQEYSCCWSNHKAAGIKYTPESVVSHNWVIGDPDLTTIHASLQVVFDQIDVQPMHMVGYCVAPSTAAEVRSPCLRFPRFSVQSPLGAPAPSPGSTRSVFPGTPPTCRPGEFIRAILRRFLGGTVTHVAAGWGKSVSDFWYHQVGDLSDNAAPQQDCSNYYKLRFF